MKPKLLILSLISLLAIGWMVWAGPSKVHAEDPPGTIVFKDTKSFAPAVFDHARHKKAGLGCGDCHDALFKKKEGSTDVDNALTMKALRNGKFCGTCHNGDQAFSVRGSCKKCHQK